MTQPAPPPQPSEKRERSSVAFPYSDLESAVKVARTAYTKAAGSCGLDQLAAWLGYSRVDNGAFRGVVNAARIFGLLTTSRKAVELTDLGVRITDPDQELRARAEAFLSVELYRKTYDEFRGRTLPPDSGLEAAFARMGVASKQTDKARQAFQRSASQAGFFDAGQDRLIEPNFPPARETQVSEADTDDAAEQDGSFSGATEAEPRRALHPFIQGLIETLPAPDSVWSDTERREWLTAAEHIFALLYTAERVQIPQEVSDPVEQATVR